MILLNNEQLKMFSWNHIKLDRKFNRIKNQSFVFIFSACTSFVLIGSFVWKQNTNNENNEPKSWRKMEVVLFALLRTRRIDIIADDRIYSCPTLCYGWLALLVHTRENLGQTKLSNRPTSERKINGPPRQR